MSNLAVNQLGIAPDRVDTIIDFPPRSSASAAATPTGRAPQCVAELAALAAAGELEVPIAGVFALDDVQHAYRTLEKQHTRGKLVLRP
jgi:NADPH:quinone reductase-like Zn-dependent oxidoreductase